MMPVAIYLKNKQKKIQSKYHQVAKHFESRYELIQRKIVSRFHRETTESEIIRYEIKNLISESSGSNGGKVISKRSIQVFPEMSIKKNDWVNPDIIDWFQGRFSGQTIRIVLREGHIIEKVLLTPKGRRILVKRNSLRFRFGSSLPVIQIKLRLRMRSLASLQRNLICI